LILLEKSPQGLTASEIRDRLSERDFEVSKRTIYRDLEALSDAGFPLFPCEGAGDESVARWVLEDGTRRVLRNIEGKLGMARREHFAEIADSSLRSALRSACAARRVLSVDYESANSGKKSRRLLGPHHLFSANGSEYLLAEDLATKQTKVFAVPRMKNAVVEPRRYEGKAVDHEKFFEASFGIFRGEKAESVRIAFAKAISTYVKERRWHASQSFEPARGGGVRMSMTVAITPELVQWILGFGPDAQVLEPEDLRVKVSDSIGRMAELYEAGKT
jgi:predicted DNA-binding transcriptional regulator YafY